MDNLEAAKTVHRLFKPVLKDAARRAESGNPTATLWRSRMMAAENIALKALGYRTTDTGRRLVPLRHDNAVMAAAIHELARSAQREDESCVCGEGEEL